MYECKTFLWTSLIHEGETFIKKPFCMTPEKYSGIPIFFVPTILQFWKKLTTKRSFGYFKKIP